MKVKVTHWQEADGTWLGYLNSYLDHWTQGESLEDPREYLRDLFQLLEGESIPGIRKEEELEMA